GVGEAAHDQGHSPHAAMPGAEQEFASAHIQPFARTCRAGHRFPPRSRRNAKSPDGPGAGHIATLTRYVSAQLHCLSGPAARASAATKGGMPPMRPNLLNPLFAPLPTLTG